MTPADIRARRTALGLTQAALAERLGVPQQTVARWESGTRTPRGRVLELALLALELPCTSSASSQVVRRR